LYISNSHGVEKKTAAGCRASKLFGIAAAICGIGCVFDFLV